MSKSFAKSRKKKYDWLLDYQEVMDWMSQLKSKNTRRDYMRGFNVFCKITDVTPQTLLDNSPEENEALLDQGMKKLIEEKLEYQTVLSKAAINSFLRFHGKKLKESAINGKDQYGRYVKKSDTDKVYGWLLEYDEINYWINDYTSKNTRENYLRVMNHFLKDHNITPPELLALPESEVIKLYTKTKQKFLQEGKPAQAHITYNSITTFFNAHRKQILWTKKDKVKVTSKKAQKQHIPTKEEIYKMADSSGSLRNRAIILCLFQSAVRRNCLRRWTYGMVKEYLYPKLQVPVRLKITQDIDTKLRGHDIPYYYTFLQDEAAESLKTYIDYQKDVEGWKPKDDDIIFVSENSAYQHLDNRDSIKLTGINDIIKRAARQIGLDPETVWTHLLRKAARKILYKAPIDNDLSEAIMGHKLKGSKENYFDRHDVDKIADEYMKAPFSREGIGRLSHLEKSEKEQNGIIANLEEENKNLRAQLTEMQDSFEDRVVDILSKYMKQQNYTAEPIELAPEQEDYEPTEYEIKEALKLIRQRKKQS